MVIEPGFTARASGGSANVTLGFNNGITVTPGGSAAINLDPEFVANVGVFDFNGGTVTSSANDNGKDGDSLTLNNNAGPATVITGTFTNLTLILNSNANLITTPNGCVSYTAAGTTSSDTIPFGTVSPNTVQVSDLSDHLTTIDFGAVTSGQVGAKNYVMNGQAWAQATQDDFLVQVLNLASMNVTGFDAGGNIALDGGTAENLSATGLAAASALTLLTPSWTVTASNFP